MSNPKETLHDCPKCGRKNFTKSGLKAHVCKGAIVVAGRRPVTLATLDAMPLAIIETRDGWERAKGWTDSAGNFERCKLACQVMAGFELIALKAEMGVRRGGDRTGANPSNLGLLGTWEETVKARVGISDETARNWMAMAMKAQPRIQKLGGADALKEILTRPASEWDAGEAEMVQATVAKLTDGKTQLDFMRELGLERGLVKTRGGDTTPKDGSKPVKMSKALQAQAHWLAYQQKAFECNSPASIALLPHLREMTDQADTEAVLGLIIQFSSAIATAARDALKLVKGRA